MTLLAIIALWLALFAALWLLDKFIQHRHNGCLLLLGIGIVGTIWIASR